MEPRRSRAMCRTLIGPWSQEFSMPAARLSAKHNENISVSPAAAILAPWDQSSILENLVIQQEDHLLEARPWWLRGKWIWRSGETRGAPFASHPHTAALSASSRPMGWC